MICGIVNPYLTGSGGGGGAPDANTLFLCRFSASPPVDEISLASGTLAGGATVDTSNHYLTTDGTGDWVTFPASSVFDLNTTDFTIEFHVAVSATEVGGVLGHQPSSGSLGRWAPYLAGDGSMKFYADNAYGGFVYMGTVDGAMHHYAFVRQGADYWGFKDGVQQSHPTGVGGTFGSSSPSQPLYIGTDPFSTTGRDIAANIGRVKISNVARWTSGFTPPAITDA